MCNHPSVPIFIVQVRLVPIKWCFNSSFITSIPLFPGSRGSKLNRFLWSKDFWMYFKTLSLFHFKTEQTINKCFLNVITYKGRTQCKLMARLFFHYLAIDNNENLRSSITTICQSRFKMKQNAEQTQKNLPKTFSNFPDLVTLDGNHGSRRWLRFKCKTSYL